MNSYAAFALATVAVVAAVGLWISGYLAWAIVALAIALPFDVLAVLALRKSRPPARNGK